MPENKHNPEKVNYGYVHGHDRAAVDARAILQIFDNSDDVPGEIVALLRNTYYEIQQQVLAEIRID